MLSTSGLQTRSRRIDAISRIAISIHSRPASAPISGRSYCRRYRAAIPTNESGSSPGAAGTVAGASSSSAGDGVRCRSADDDDGRSGSMDVAVSMASSLPVAWCWDSS